MKAMIFAAGLGTRLRPLTDTVPKALIEVGGITMLERVIRKIAAAGISEIAVNIHHHAAKVRHFIETHHIEGVSISVCDESEMLLDTGGGVAAAAPLLGYDDDILLHNADILTDFDLGEMMTSHTSSGADATLLADTRNTSRYLLFDHSGKMTGWQNTSTGEVRSPFGDIPTDSYRHLAFGGIHIISPNTLRTIASYSQANPVFSITPFYTNMCGTLDIRAFTPSAPYSWFDIGRPETLAKARDMFADSKK